MRVLCLPSSPPVNSKVNLWGKKKEREMFERTGSVTLSEEVCLVMGLERLVGFSEQTLGPKR